MKPLDPVELQTAVQDSLRAWYDLESPGDTLLDCLLLVRERRAVLGIASGPTARRRAINEVLLNSFDELQTIEPRGTDILRAHFLDQEKVRSIANRLNLSTDQINRLQTAALKRLTDLLLARELALRSTWATQMEAALPPAPPQALHGVAESVEQLCQHLVAPDLNPIVVICGIGGIGKTALARATAAQVIREFYFESIVWVRYAPGGPEANSAEAIFDTIVGELAHALGSEDSPSAKVRLNRVREALRSRPHLAIIDNLETDADVTSLLEQLPALVGPSKFLLTSRTQPPTGAAQASIWPVTELLLQDATALMFDQANLNGKHMTSTFTQSEAEAIYAVTGGNPLALKLVTGLAQVQALPQLLLDLRHSRTREVDGLYRRIYQRVWTTLSGPARALLQAMPLVAESGALPPQLLAISGLSEPQLWPAIMELWSRSLLEARGNVQEKRYGIHRLTDTFLRSDINRWDDAPPS